MNPVYIVDAVRTPFARRGPGTGVATLRVGVGQGLTLVLERP
ncbi:MULTISPECIES: hypothetical protein [Streptomyces]|nr:hypothetical protein [Streptomyces sp. WI03-4A]MDX2592211.1 hypothetical protein [Streptomyces sp. WI03-4A]